MTSRKQVEALEVEMRRLTDSLEKLKIELMGKSDYYQDYSQYSATAKRRSMDLTRQLAQFRKPDWRR